MGSSEGHEAVVRQLNSRCDMGARDSDIEMSGIECTKSMLYEGFLVMYKTYVCNCKGDSKASGIISAPLHANTVIAKLLYDHINCLPVCSVFPYQVIVLVYGLKLLPIHQCLRIGVPSRSQKNWLCARIKSSPNSGNLPWHLPPCLLAYAGYVGKKIKKK